MNATKKKILIRSLDLFNDRGISNVSLRNISDEMGISVGNLQYHFKKREDIIESLYYQLVDEINNVFEIDPEFTIKSFFNSTNQVIAIFYGYRFFLLDFVTIVRNNSIIGKHYSELSKFREKSFMSTVTILIEKNLIRKEEIKDEYKSLFIRMEVISNFWFSSVFIQSKKLNKRVLKEYINTLGNNIYPYLTEKGKNEFNEYFN